MMLELADWMAACWRERAPVAVQAFPVPCLQCNADACSALETAVSQSNRPMSAYGPLDGPSSSLLAALRLTCELFLLGWAWSALDGAYGLGPSPSFLCSAQFLYLSLIRATDCTSVYYRNRGSSSCCEASRDHLNLAKIGGTGFALRTTEPTPKVTLARGLPTEDGSASRPPRPIQLSRED